jgi:hypothetical protein
MKVDFSREVDRRIFLCFFCLICSASIAVLKEYNIGRQYNSKHKEDYKNCANAMKRDNVMALKRRMVESQRGVFRKQCSGSSCALRESYRVSSLLAKGNKTFPEREFMRKCLQYVGQEFCPEKETGFNIVCFLQP